MNRNLTFFLKFRSNLCYWKPPNTFDSKILIFNFFVWLYVASQKKGGESNIYCRAISFCSLSSVVASLCIVYMALTCLGGVIFTTWILNLNFHVFLIPNHTWKKIHGYRRFFAGVSGTLLEDFFCGVLVVPGNFCTR